MTGNLPCVKWGYEAISASNSLPYLKEQFCDLDQYADPSDAADQDAYRIMLWELVDPSFQSLIWHEGSPFSRESRSVYARHVPFPIDGFLRLQRKSTVTQQSAVRGLEVIEKVLDNIYKSYKVLHDKLGPHRYFSRTNRPATLDACTAARIYLHFHLPSPNNPLRETLSKKFPSLVLHAQRVLAENFPEYKIEEALRETTTPVVWKQAEKYAHSALNQLATPTHCRAVTIQSILDAENDTKQQLCGTHICSPEPARPCFA